MWPERWVGIVNSSEEPMDLMTRGAVRLRGRLATLPRRLARSLAFAVVLGSVPVWLSTFALFCSYNETGPQSASFWALVADTLLTTLLVATAALLFKRRERELSRFISLESERQRYHNVGEISGLVIHDLSSHLMLINFGVQILKDKPEKIKDPLFLEGLVNGAARADELIGSLRSYLKAPEERGASREATLGDCLNYIHSLLRLRFSEETMDGIRIRTDPRLRDVVVTLSKSEMIHILINLMANSVGNLIDSAAEDPSVEIERAEDAEDELDYLVFTISDNGSGLSPDAFIRLTSSDARHGPDDVQGMGKSMGLRLIRRLIEREMGAISIEEYPRLGVGTTFRIKLPKKQDAQTPPGPHESKAEAN